MATTEAQVCNLALAAVGERQFIDALTDKTASAIICAALYPQARDSVLGAHGWRMATRRAVLALTAETRTGWGYCYALPADCLAPRFLALGVRPLAASVDSPFVVEANDAGDGLLLLCDVPEAELVYTRRTVAVGLWPPSFVEAVAADLAARLAAAIPEHRPLANTLMQVAGLRLQQAVATDCNAQPQDSQPVSDIIRSRG